MVDAATKESAAMASRHWASVVIRTDPTGQLLVLMAPST
jgi:hypothetical protein